MFMTFNLVSLNLRLIGCFPWIVLTMVVSLGYDCTMALRTHTGTVVHVKILDSIFVSSWIENIADISCTLADYFEIYIGVSVRSTI